MKGSLWSLRRCPLNINVHSMPRTLFCCDMYLCGIVPDMFSTISQMTGAESFLFVCVRTKNEKNSSMELAVIWGNFGFSDLGCFDLGWSDLACSDLACSDLGHFFKIKILTFFTQHSQLGNSFSTHPNGTNLTKWNFYTSFHNNIHILTKRIAQYPFLNFLLKRTF